MVTVTTSPQTLFLRRALTDQLTMGAVAPTSAPLATRLAALVPPGPGARVVELGAGTGAISRAIAARLGPDAVHLAVERDPELLAHVARAAPRALRVAGDAADVRHHLATAGLDRADVVLSSLPWSNLPADEQRRVLDAVRAVLAPTGTFATITYRPTRLTPGARRFRALVADRFDQVVSTSTTWASLPPARLLVARPGDTEAGDA